MRRLALGMLRTLRRLAVRLDRLDLPLLARIPSKFKLRALRRVLWLASPLLPAVVPVAGVRLAAPRSHLHGYLLTAHEPEVTELIARHLARGQTAIDVGANIGYLTLQMARSVGSDGRVWSLEPAPGNLEWLLRNVRLNGLTQVRVLAAAAGSARRLRRLDLGTGSTRHSLYGAPDHGDVLEVPEMPLDEVVDGPVHLVKIDVEGAELEVLRGMERILAENPRLVLIVEQNPERLAAAGEGPQAVVEHLSARGFEVHRIGPGGELCSPTTAANRGHIDLLARRPAGH